MRAPSAAWLACVLLAGCESGAPDDEVNAALGTSIPRVVSLQEALGTSELPSLDLHTMNDAEIAKVLGAGTFCAFRYVSDGKPVLAWKSQSAATDTHAVVKLNGVLVQLQSDSGAGNTQFVADELHINVRPDDEQQRDRSERQPREAKLLFEIGDKLRVGYGGYLVCPV